MSDPDYDVHPLDRDYSEPEAKPKRLPKMPEGQVHRAGVIIFSVGFVALLVTAALLGIFEGSRPIETFGSYVHRFAMVMILVGGILIIVGLRVRTWSLRGPKFLAGKIRTMRGLGWLLVINVVAFFTLLGLFELARGSLPRGAASTIYSGSITILAGLMAMMILLHRGIVRGFAVGALVTMLLGSMGVLAFTGYFGSRSASALVTQHLLMVQVTGIVCAVYAALFDNTAEASRTETRGGRR